MKQLVEGTDGPDMPTIKEFWSAYHIKKAIDNINASWKEVTDKTMNGCWGKLWPECNTGFGGFDGAANVRAITNDIVRLSHLAGFREVDEDDIEDLLESHDEPLTNEELMDLAQERALNEETEAEEENEPQRGLDVGTLREVLNGMEHLMELLKERDPNPARS